MRSFLSSSFATLGLLACLVGRTNAELRNVFAHYLVGGVSSLDEAVKDVTDAKALGLDAFALNVQQPSAASTKHSLGLLFDAAHKKGFKLFFSFDMTTIDAPSDFLPLFNHYKGNAAYYHHDGRPFVSTFGGGSKSFGASCANEGWQQQFKDVLSKHGVNPFFVPDFEDYGGAAYDPKFFDDYPVVDGAFGWETAWPQISDGVAHVNDTNDRAGIKASHAAKKVYMMPLSSLQFKHTDAGNNDAGNNTYRIGEVNLAERMVEILFSQPDFVEIISWNDAAESNYIGNIWPCATSGAPAVRAYTDGYNHTAWQAILAPFIRAYKAGKNETESVTPSGKFAGAFWYRPLLKDAKCAGDPLGRPQGADNAQDLLNVVSVVPRAQSVTGITVRVTSGTNQTAANIMTESGLNIDAVPIGLGAQKVELVDADGKVFGVGSSTQDVVSDTNGTCNFNVHVVQIVSV